MRFFSFNVLITSLKPHNPLFVGGVAEWSNAPVLKTDEGESPPRVRIPVPPPQSLRQSPEVAYKFIQITLFPFVLIIFFLLTCFMRSQVVPTEPTSNVGLKVGLGM